MIIIMNCIMVGINFAGHYRVLIFKVLQQWVYEGTTGQSGRCPMLFSMEQNCILNGGIGIGLNTLTQIQYVVW